MRFRLNRDERPEGGGQGSGEGSGQLGNIRRKAQAFLSAGDQAIGKAVSVDSEETNRQLAQPGGQ